MKNEFYTTDEVAGIFRVTRKTIYNWVEGGKLKAVRTSKRSGSKLLFPKENVHAELQPVIADIRKDINQRLADGLVGLFVKLSNGKVCLVRGVSTAPNSSIEILVDNHGWFTLAGESLAQGEGKDWRIIGYYSDPNMAN